jgi:hypothetical protein
MLVKVLVCEFLICVFMILMKLVFVFNVEETNMI